jgi:hypothetical protein
MRRPLSDVLKLLPLIAASVGSAGMVRAQVAVPIALPAQPGAPNQPGVPSQPGNPGGQPGAQQPAQPVTVTNIEDKQFQGPAADFVDGKLTVKSEPPQTVAMDELQKVAFIHPTKLALEWIGQEPRDLVQVGAAEGGNGIQDVHLRANGLTARRLTQVIVVCKPLFRVWRLDVNQSPHWKVGVERIGQAAVAEIFFEPPAKDLFEQELEVTLTFDDNTTAKGTVKAASHTSDQAKIETTPEGATAPQRRLATVVLEGGDSLRAFLKGGEQERIVLDSAWNAALEVPLSQVRGLMFDGGKPEVKTKFDERFLKPGDEDYVLVESKDGGFAEIAGQLLSLGASGAKINFEGQERSIKLERIQAVVMAAHPSANAWKGPYQVFKLSSGDSLAAAWLTQSETAYQVKSAWGTEIALPRQAVVEITGKNTKMVNVSELTPIAVEQVSFFDRLIPWVRDKSWNNRPLKLDGKTYGRGLAMHSRSVLTYDLGGEFASFRAVLGIDEDAGERGRVNCRVTVDDQELFSKIDLRAGEKPLPIEVSVKGGKVLKLEVDFGEDEDTGDRVIWANARFYRE